MSFSLFAGQSVKFPLLSSRRMLALSDALFGFQAFHTSSGFGVGKSGEWQRREVYLKC